MTDLRRKFKSAAPDALRAQAINYRAQIGDIPAEFPETRIDLRPTPKSRLSPDYEAGNVCAKFYPATAIPTLDTLLHDLHKMLSLYEALRTSENAPIGTAITEDDESDNPNFHTEEDYRKFRYHKRIERSQKLAKRVKKLLGYTCLACGFNFSSVYIGVTRNEYIEAHHLKPISELKGRKVSLDPSKDFAVLCANCHRMIHRFEHPEDLAGFKKAIAMKITIKT